MQRLLAFGLTVAAVAWAVLIVWVPLRAADRRAALTTAVVYAAGSLVCHQRPERSFHARGVALPVCARCAGLYLAGALGALAGWIGTRLVPRRFRVLLIAAALPTAITIGLELAGMAEPPNAVRALAGAALGGVSGWLFVGLLRAESARSTCVMIS